VSSPYTIEITSHVLLTWTDEPSYDMCRRALDEVLAHPNFRKGMPAIAICGRSAYSPPGLELHSMAIDLGELREQIGPMALVVNTDLHFRLGRILRDYCRSEGLRFEVFQVMSDALAWIRGDTGTHPAIRSHSKVLTH